MPPYRTHHIAFLKLINEIAIASNESVTVESAVQRSLQSICHATGWPVGHAMKCYTDGHLESLHIWHISEAYRADKVRELQAFCQASQDRSFITNEGLPGRVLAAGVPIWVISLQDDANFPRREAAGAAGLGAGFAFPVYVGDRITAVLEFFSSDTQPPQPALLQVMAHVGVQLGRVFERQAAQQALETSEWRSRKIIESAGGAFIGMNDRGVITAWNHAAETMFGWSSAQAIGRKISDTIMPKEYRHSHERGLKRFLESGESKVLGQRLELSALRRNGQEFPIEITLWSMEEAGRWSFFAFSYDITERKKIEKELERRALYDSLTGLPNRTLLMDRIMTYLSSRDIEKSGLSVFFIDINSFKRINDSFGHEAGDKAIIAAANFLRNAIRPNDTIARFSGDEFVIACPGVGIRNDAAIIAKRLLDSLRSPIIINGNKVYITASIGIAIAALGNKAEDLIRFSDIAMYEAKSVNHGGYQFFDATMQSNMEEKLALEAELHHAIDNHELTLYFQPLVSARTGVVVSLEALIRWQHPVKGIIPPSDFIPVAEETGLITPIGLWVIEEVFRQASRWIKSGFLSNPLSIMVNISPKQLYQDGFVEKVMSLYNSYDLSTSWFKLGLEVTETSVMHDAKGSIKKLKKLRDLGVIISIDDFGTGYSSLSQLNILPIDIIKIDKEFISRISSTDRDKIIVKCIADMAHAMGMIVVAEGVETEEQLVILKEIGIDVFQGFLFSPPVPIGGIERLLHNDKGIHSL